MMLGVKEFRERFSEIAEGKEQVFVTKNGRIVGEYKPMRDTAERVRDWAEIEARLDAVREEWKARTPDWEQRMKDYGLGPDGEILDS
ncbi:hypothetical protein ASG11_16795 [Sphingomonas sp. Leaf357]|uniref:hypothetical protein n=1 Tax=Sphingomonas sp. Leaf357 TaxID=1736350 RepID=UPI0006F6DA33|nr:hypothetical protein [Sphingomonas sp. Leaf357]KQS01343.1 hypothetical protein ASG11_16795 [Sphingomonas sp. Leaf357]